MKKHGYVVLGLSFATKSALLQHCSTLLKQSSLSLSDEEFLRALLDGHPEREQKIGGGVRRIFIGGDGFGKQCFWLERIDGTTTDFSFRACVTPPPHTADVYAALRQLVTPQVIAFRDAAFAGRQTVACAITGRPVESDVAHVDHRPPATFVSVVARFLADRRLAIGDVAVEPTRDGVTGRYLVDAELAASWCAYHGEHAALQIVCKRANLSQGAGSGDVRR